MAILRSDTAVKAAAGSGMAPKQRPRFCPESRALSFDQGGRSESRWEYRSASSAMTGCLRRISCAVLSQEWYRTIAENSGVCVSLFSRNSFQAVQFGAEAVIAVPETRTMAFCFPSCA